MKLPGEVDVLVVGFGAPGASAAIAAHDASASVAVVEKTAAGGGLTDAIVFGRTAGAVAAADRVAKPVQAMRS